MSRRKRIDPRLLPRGVPGDPGFDVPPPDQPDPVLAPPDIATATPSPLTALPPAPALPGGEPNGLLARGWSGDPDDLLQAVEVWHAEEAAYADGGVIPIQPPPVRS